MGEASVERSGTGSSPSKSVEMVQRLTYRRRHSYATKSNRVKKVKTPGGKLTYHYVAKKSNPAVDPMDKQILNGIPVLRPAKGSKSQTNKKDRCPPSVRRRSVRGEREEQDRQGLPHRGAEDCQEGA